MSLPPVLKFSPLHAVLTDFLNSLHPSQTKHNLDSRLSTISRKLIHALSALSSTDLRKTHAVPYCILRNAENVPEVLRSYSSLLEEFVEGKETVGRREKEKEVEEWDTELDKTIEIWERWKDDTFLKGRIEDDDEEEDEEEHLEELEKEEQVIETETQEDMDEDNNNDANKDGEDQMDDMEIDDDPVGIE